MRTAYTYSALPRAPAPHIDVFTLHLQHSHRRVLVHYAIMYAGVLTQHTSAEDAHTATVRVVINFFFFLTKNQQATLIVLSTADWIHFP